jgi:hypothetical protein
LGEREEVIKNNPYGHRAGIPLLTHQPMDLIHKVLPELLLEPLHSHVFRPSTALPWNP